MFRTAALAVLACLLAAGCSKPGPRRESSASVVPPQVSQQQPGVTIPQSAFPAAQPPASAQSERYRQLYEAAAQNQRRINAEVEAATQRNAAIAEQRARAAEAARASAEQQQQARQVQQQHAAATGAGPARQRDDTAIANTVASVVEGALKNPGSAQWGTPSISQQGPQTTDRNTRQIVTTYRVSGYVDSTNSYGATGRLSYSGLVRGQLTQSGETYSLVPDSLTINDPM